MAINQINPVTNSLSGTITAQNKVYKTQADITLTNFATTGVPQVQAGTIFANNGTLFEVDANAAINDSGVANGWVYVKYSVGNARFEYTVGAPTWSDDKQGYYSGNDRYFFKMYKVGAAEFRYKVKFKRDYDLGRPFETGIYRAYSAQTENTIFDDLTYLIPNANDMEAATGWYLSGGTFSSCTAVARSDATNMHIEPDNIAIVDGDTVAHTLNINILLDAV